MLRRASRTAAGGKSAAFCRDVRRMHRVQNAPASNPYRRDIRSTRSPYVFRSVRHQEQREIFRRRASARTGTQSCVRCAGAVCARLAAGVLLAAFGCHLSAEFFSAARLTPRCCAGRKTPIVDELFADMVAHGRAALRARFPRAYLDLNREPYELDPRMFEGRLPVFANTRSSRRGRIGTIARVVGEFAGNLRRPAQSMRHSPASTSSISPITARLRSCSSARTAFRHRHSHRLPFHALGSRRPFAGQ